jgi:hypothetical protein
MKAIFFITILFLAHIAKSQDTMSLTTIEEKPTYPWSYSTEVGLNMTNLLTKFVPLSFNNESIQMIGVKYRWYRRNRAIKIDVGASVDSDNGDQFRQQFFFFSFGVEKRRALGTNKFSYSSAWEMTLNANPNDFFFGFSRGYGIEYHFSNYAFVSTQTSLTIGASDQSGLAVKLLPPTSIFLNVRF